MLPLALLAAAWQPLLSPSRTARPCRCAAPSARIKNAASEGAAEWNKNPSLTPPKKAIAPDRPDMSSPQQTFDALCRMCGVAPGRDAAIDFDGFVLAFEQLYNRGVPLDPEPLDELRAAVGAEDDADLTMARWDAFHKGWIDASRMEAHLASRVATKRLTAEVQEEREAAAAALAKRESEWSQALIKAKQEAAETIAPPKLLAAEAEKARKKRGKWFEEQESSP